MHANIVNVQRFSLHDGPGIRTVVFFKGCSLRCRWCANPECISPVPELGFSKALCNQCGNCFSECTKEALEPTKNGMLLLNRGRCTHCGQCVGVCPQKALVIYGKAVTLEELFEEVQRDQIFYNQSDGGITVSGGEPMLQADFVLALFKLCTGAGLTTAVETCGYIKSDLFQRVLEYTDYVLYDLKSLEKQRHLELTGKPNRLILNNARIAAGSGVRVQFRLPLIPGLNDGPENVKMTADFLRQLGKDKPFPIELMPYHRLGIGKYEALGKNYSLMELESAVPAVVEQARQRFEAQGINCLVSS
jgi:pyruvate formate lyase activating enzyme